jgi:hypothetical protein
MPNKDNHADIQNKNDKEMFDHDTFLSHINNRLKECDVVVDYDALALLFDTYVEHIERLKKGLANGDNFFSISHIEQIVLELIKSQKDIDLNFLIKEMNCIGAEGIIIEKKNCLSLNKE